MRNLLFIPIACVAALFSTTPAYAQCDQLPGCELAWSDEFNGTGVDSSKWEFQLGDGTTYGIPGWGNNEKQWYQTDNATVSGGILTIEAREESVGGKQYTSSRLRSLGKGDFLYGRFEMRAALPFGQGLWPAFWMLSSNPGLYGGWPASGEIDIMEQIGGNRIYGTVHYGNIGEGSVFFGGHVDLPPGQVTNFHEYAVEWEPTEIRWYYDGQLYFTRNDWFSGNEPYPAPFDVDFHLLLNFAVGGNFPGDPPPSTTFPQEYRIDYVRVYQQPPPDPADAAKCEASKNKAAGKYAKCRGNAMAKSIKKTEPVESFKLIKCSIKIGSQFSKAEDKASGSCPTEGDADDIESDIDACIDDVVTDLGGAPGAGGEEAKCQSKKVKEAGKYFQCRGKTLFKAIKKGLSVDYTKCETKLSTKWTKLETGVCSTTGDHATVKADLDACHAMVATSFAGPSCGDGTLDLGEECDDGNVASGDGCSSQCELEFEYEQDFEGLSISEPSELANDGWKVFGNVFTSGGGYLYGYGPFGAPNAPGAFCNITSGEGGAAQGSQQLVVVSDYNNGDHANGHTIESFVFRERTLLATDVGQTFTFDFDAKLGNLVSPTTAEAFIKTLDPNNNFSVSAIDSVDMTSAPATWGPYSLSIDIHAGLEGHVLQYGFSNRATNYDGSGVVYDNILVNSETTP